MPSTTQSGPIRSRVPLSCLFIFRRRSAALSSTESGGGVERKKKDQLLRFNTYTFIIIHIFSKNIPDIYHSRHFFY